MTDERDKPSGTKESSARNTARDVPYVRGAGSESEPAPRGQRPNQLPRDPTYEAELAQVELAVLRDRERRADPSTKPGGARGHDMAVGQPPESVTPESPQAGGFEVARDRSPEPPGSGGRAVASGTLLSVGAVDPRGKTERTLETPRMFISQADQSGEAYFKPGKIPSVTVHQTLETETVKLSDSIDPRRAKTIPRMDRAVPPPESANWDQQDYEPASSLGDRRDGQIHASLSPFRNQAAESGQSGFSLDGAPTRPEPFALRRASEPSPPPEPDTSTVPTHRDLPVHRIEASRPPPPPPHSARDSSPGSLRGEYSESEGPRPMTASIAGEEPQARPVWVNLAAFAAALVLALLLGWLVTSRAPEAKQAPPASPSAALPQPAAKAVDTAPAPAPDAAAATPAQPPAAAPPAVAAPAVVAPAVVATPKPAAVVLPKAAPALPVPAAAPRKTDPPKSTHETIF